jgi:hypothetical protein
MRVIFLSSAYFGYVHTYTFNPAAYSYAAAPEQPVSPALVTDTEAPQMSKAGDPLLARLIAWVHELTKENATC